MIPHQTEISPATPSPPFWILLSVALRVFFAFSCLYIFLGNLFLQLPLLSSQHLLAMDWKHFIYAVISFLMARGLLKGKNWVRLLELTGGVLVVLFIVITPLLGYIFSFEKVTVALNLPLSRLMYLTLCVTLVVSCLTIYGMTRESSRCWCGMSRPFPVNTHWFIIILAILSFTEFQNRFRLQQEKRHAFPVDTNLQFSVEGRDAPLDEDEWRELKMRFERRGRLFPPSVKLRFDDANREISLQGVAFNSLNLPVRLRQFESIRVSVDPESPKVIEIRLKEQTW